MPFSRLFLFACIWLLGLARAEAQFCEIKPAAALPLGYAAGLATVPAKVNGIEVTMGIDTGDDKTLVTPETVARLNLQRDSRRYTREFGTTAVSDVGNVVLSSFEFAGTRYGAWSVASIALPALAGAGTGKPKPVASPPAGLIGADLLSQYDVDFDLGARSMRLYKVQNCSKITPPWTEPYTPLAIKVTPDKKVWMPVEIDGYRLSALLDTGATSFAITKSAARKAGVTETMLKADPAAETRGVGGVVLKEPAHRFNTVLIGGETLQNLQMPLIGIDLGQNALVGQTYLLSRRVWISYSTQMLYIGAPKVPVPLQNSNAPSAAFQAELPAGSAVPPADMCDPDQGCELPAIPRVIRPGDRLRPLPAQ
jgi:predicted aspartyl protease